MTTETIYRNGSSVYYTSVGKAEYEAAHTGGSLVVTPVTARRYKIKARIYTSPECGKLWLSGNGTGTERAVSSSGHTPKSTYFESDGATATIEYYVYSVQQSGGTWEFVAVRGAHPSHGCGSLWSSITGCIVVVPANTAIYRFASVAMFVKEGSDVSPVTIQSGGYNKNSVSYEGTSKLARLFIGENSGVLDKELLIYVGGNIRLFLDGEHSADAGVNPLSVTSKKSSKWFRVLDAEDFNENGTSYTSGTDASAVARSFNMQLLPDIGEYAQYAPEVSLLAPDGLTYHDAEERPYPFIGANTAADGTGTFYPVGASLAGILTRYPSNDTYLLRFLHLYSKWVQGFFGIETGIETPSGTSEAISGSISVSGQTHRDDGATFLRGATITAVAPTMRGFEFVRWRVTATFGNEAVDISELDIGGTEPTLEFVIPETFASDISTISIFAVYSNSGVTVEHGIAEASMTALNGGATTTVTPPTHDGEYWIGDAVTFSAPAGSYVKDGYSFAGWYDGDEKVSESNPFTCNIGGDTALTARYNASVSFAKSESVGASGELTVNGGQVVGVATFDFVLGGVVPVAAHVLSGYFSGWKFNGASVPSLGAEGEITIAAAGAYVAAFAATATKVHITCTSEKNDPDEQGNVGTLSVQGGTLSGGTYEVEAYSQIVLVPTAASVSPLPLYKVTDSGVPILPPYSVFIGNEDRTFKSFWGTKTRFTVSVSASAEGEAGGSATVGEQGATSVECDDGDILKFRASPLEGCKLSKWQRKVGGVWEDMAGPATTSFVMEITESVELRAVFAADDFAIFRWEGSGENKTLMWTSRMLQFARPFDPVAARVDATGYPVQLDVGTYSSPDAEPTRPHYVTVESQNGRRLPRMRPERYMQFTVRASSEVDGIVVASNMAEAN